MATKTDKTSLIIEITMARTIGSKFFLDYVVVELSFNLCFFCREGVLDLEMENFKPNPRAGQGLGKVEVDHDEVQKMTEKDQRPNP
jgi:hypothetical protein